MKSFILQIKKKQIIRFLKLEKWKKKSKLNFAIENMLASDFYDFFFFPFKNEL